LLNVQGGGIPGKSRFFSNTDKNVNTPAVAGNNLMNGLPV